jgi:putative ABC transport system permease protein
LNSLTFHINLYDLAALGTIFIGLNFALLLWFTKSINRSANRFLALALVTMILWMVRILAIDVRLETDLPDWDRLPMQFLLALGPLIYFYVLKITRPEYRFGGRDLLHFSPLLLEQAVLLLEIRESNSTGTATYDTSIFQQLNPILQLLIFISITTYLYQSHKLIQNFYRRLLPVLMDRSLLQFRWLDRLLAATGLLWTVWIAYAAVDYFGYRNQLGIHIYYPLYIFFAVIIIWTAAAAFLRPQAEMPVQVSSPAQPSDAAELKERGILLRKAIDAGFFYRDPELTIASLADKLKLPPRELSRIINIALKKNFNDFINEYRVRDVIQKMQDAAYNHLTLLGIAFESGFNSKSTFNRIFKEMTGKSPAEYKAQLKKERPIRDLGRLPRLQPLKLDRETIPQWSSEKLNGNFMFRNYLKIGIRNLWAKKAFSFINVTGLAVGMAGAILIALWVQNEYSFDSFHVNNKTLYKVWYRFVAKDYVGTQDITAGPLAKALKDEFPDVKNASRIYWSEGHLFNYKEVSLKANGNEVDKDFLKMFTFPLTEGSPAHALDDVNSVVLTRHLATKIFGSADPLNQIIKLDGKQVYKVTGVMQDLPNNTEFDFEYLLSIPATGAYNDNSWSNRSYYTYVQLQPGADASQVNQKIRLVAHQHIADKRDNTEVFLYPFSKMHLYSRFENGKVAGGRIEVIRLLLIIAGIILLTACINFMNLSTAQSHKRAMEVGVRKVMGATRINLVGQFLAESLAIAFIAGIVALLLAMVTLPAFNQLTTKNLHVQYGNPVFWLVFLGFILLTGILAGSYPAFFLSAFRPVKVLKGRLNAVSRVFNPRKVLVVLQFAVAVVLIVSTIVVYRQVKFAQSRDIGYRIDHLIEVPIEGDIRKNFDLIKNDLIASGAAVSACRTSITVTMDGATGGGISTNGTNLEQQNIDFSRFGTSGDFVKTMGLTLIGGRDLDLNAYPADSAISCMINETAVKQLGIKDPVGGTLYQGSKPMRIVGVFKDFIINSPYVNNRPMIVFASKSWAYNTVIRLNGSNGIARDLQLAEKTFKKYNPAYPFTYQFADTEYQQKFNDQQQTGKLAAIFACLTIFISCLGLFGLASYMAENRSKEIGIRKVLGASVMSITSMLAREFVILVLIAIAIATPVALWATNKWLQDFTYRISIGWLTFIIAGLSAVLIAVLTVSFRSIRAAMANPVDSIRSE